MTAAPKAGGAAPYRAGTIFERHVQAHLARNGYLTIRSAGSKGHVDIVALKRGQVLLVQCKRGTMRGKEWNALVELAEQCNAVPILAEPRSGKGAPRYTVMLQKHRDHSSIWPGRPFSIDYLDALREPQ